MSKDSGPSPGPRPHTGRRRNELARRAILEATARLMSAEEPGPLTVESIAAEAGVGKQTLYRWWPSKGAVVLAALAETAAARVPLPDTGSLRGDLETFLIATIREIREEPTTRMLRRLAREAAVDQHAAELLRDFAQHRRTALRELLDRHRAHLEADLDLLIDQVYGTIWYRLLLGHAELDDLTARALSAAVIAQPATTSAPDDQIS